MRLAGGFVFMKNLLFDKIPVPDGARGISLGPDGTVVMFTSFTSIVRYDRGSVRRGEPVVAAFAAMERLDAHGRSVKIRTE